MILAAALADPSTQARYRAKVRRLPGSDCWWWVGAISGRGHGRLWIGGGRVVIAHRYGYGLVHGVDAVAAARVLMHDCDQPLCQNPAHLVAGDHTSNRRSWAGRRGTPGSVLRDRRGSRARSEALRTAILTGVPLAEALAAGADPWDTAQQPLW